MNLMKKVKEIEEHFATISKEELDANLKDSGYGQIQPASSEVWKRNKTCLLKERRRNGMDGLLEEKLYEFFIKSFL